MPQRLRHAQCSIDIFDMLCNRYADDPTVGVFYDFFPQVPPGAIHIQPFQGWRIPEHFSPGSTWGKE
ncbi:MAG TPA: hypothetical protein ENG03_07825 [Thioploca sp.]|nr:hypothetical protein [Thioploca sp.]